MQFVANDSNHYKFTGKERDSETSLDYFGARYYSNGLGRFVSPDWSATPVPVPYADFCDPQSLNLYCYVRNNPVWRADLDGHGWWHALKNWASDGGWTDNDAQADQTRKQRLHVRAMQARTDILRAKGIMIHNQTPQEFVQGKTDQQLVDAQREMVDFFRSKVQFPVQCPEGVSCGVAFPFGLKGLAIEEGAASEYTNITTGSSVNNIRTSVTAGEFGAALEADGYVKSTLKDGTPTYTKGNRQYTVYSNSRSTGEVTAQVKINGDVVGKIRLK